MATILGFRLRRIREELSLTQEEVARAAGLSSEFISQIEIGRKDPSLQSLKKIAGFFKKDMAFFLPQKKDPFAILLEEKEFPGNRRLLKRFQEYCQDYLKLEEMTGRRLPSAPFYSGESPQSIAESERRRVGAGEEPFRDLFELLEGNGLRILREPFSAPNKLAGVFVYYATEQAAFGLIDANQPDGRQALTAAHLYGHYLRDRMDGPIADNTDIFVKDYLPLYHPRERRAQEFALAFLIPQDQLRRMVLRDLLSVRIQYEDLVRYKRYFGVPMEDMMSALAEMGQLSPQQAGDLSAHDHADFEMSLFGDLAGDQPPAAPIETRTSARYKTLAVIALGKNPPESSEGDV